MAVTMTLSTRTRPATVAGRFSLGKSWCLKERTVGRELPRKPSNRRASLSRAESAHEVSPAAVNCAVTTSGSLGADHPPDSVQNLNARTRKTCANKWLSLRRRDPFAVPTRSSGGTVVRNETGRARPPYVDKTAASEDSSPGHPGREG